MTDKVEDLKRRVREIERGQKWRDGHGEIKVMAVVDNYVVWRRPRYVPGVLHVKDFLKRFEKAA